ncbi:MAG: hypothetical protein WDM92_07920 [Caulobacteraceae bacterium]
MERLGRGRVPRAGQLRLGVPARPVELCRQEHQLQQRPDRHHPRRLQPGSAAGRGRHGSWTGAVFVKNLLDERANLGDMQLWSGELPGRNEFLIAQPRAVGVELTKAF